jgi:hypothetical protein
MAAWLTDGPEGAPASWCPARRDLPATAARNGFGIFNVGCLGGGGRAGLCQALFDESAGEFVEVVAGGVGEVAQGSLPGEYCQPVHGGPDGVFDAVAAPPVEDPGVGQLVEHGAQMTQGCAVLPGPAIGSFVGVLLR